jgi:hypothetical protein
MWNGAMKTARFNAILPTGLPLLRDLNQFWLHYYTNVHTISKGVTNAQIGNSCKVTKYLSLINSDSIPYSCEQEHMFIGPYQNTEC